MVSRTNLKDWVGLLRDILIILGIIFSVLYSFFPTAKRWILTGIGGSSYYFVADYCAEDPPGKIDSNKEVFSYDDDKIKSADVSKKKSKKIKGCLAAGAFNNSPDFRHYRWRKGYFENKQRKRATGDEIIEALDAVKGDIIYTLTPHAFGRSDAKNLAEIDIIAKKNDCLYVKSYKITDDSSVTLDLKEQKSWIKNLWVEGVIVNCGPL